MVRSIGFLVAAVLATAPATATTISYSGTGKVDRVDGSLPQTGTATLGSDLRFSLDYDTDMVRTYSVDDEEGVYDVPVSGFAATIGGYDFVQSADPVYVPTLVLSYYFTFLGDPSSTRVLGADLYLTGTLKPAGSTASPFAIPAGGHDTLVLSSLYLAGDADTSLAFDRFRDPALALRQSFTYQVRDVAARRFGRLSGSFVGRFADAAAVPEPATWAMMLLGFMLSAIALRSRRERRVQPAA